MSNAPLLVGLATTLALPVGARGDGGWSLDAPGRPLAVKGKIIKGRDVSGIASVADGLFLLGSDEARVVQTGRIDMAAGTLRIDEAPIPLLAGEGSEIDIEGVAVSREKHCYYITGSHSLSRKKKTFEADRHWVFRLPVDPATGAPQPDKIQKVSLRPVLQADVVLKAFVDKSTDENGLDIEALAQAGGKLYFGLRAPSLGGHAFVLVTDAEALFTAAKPVFDRFEVPLGVGRGLRDLAPLKDGFLFIAGSSGSTDEPPAAAPQPGHAHGFELYFWPGPDQSPVRIGALTPPPEAKAEALLVWREAPDLIEVIIMHDGVKDGAPTLYRIHPPAGK